MRPPERAAIVVVGGGVIGTSVAYHLATLGRTDVVLLEQGHLSSGTTWHAAGLVGQLRASESGTRLVQYSAALYDSLEAETGLATGWKQCGGLTVARTPDRMTQLRRTAANAVAYDLECELLTPTEVGERCPILRTDDLVGGIWLPQDGKANPADLTMSLAKGARSRGVRVHEQVRVTGIELETDRVRAVAYDGPDGPGRIETETVVNCAGQWAYQVGGLVGATTPLHSAEHFYVVTEPFEGVTPDLPVLRDPDGYTYFKEEVGGLVVGGFEPEAKPWVRPDQVPYPFEFQLLGEDWEHFSVLMDSALHRVPALEEVGIRRFYNGPESFTPDNQFLLGPAPGLEGYWVGAGFNSVGIATAGGAGRALAEWIDAGEPTTDLTGVDVRRFAGFQNDVGFLHDRVAEVLGLHYAIPWPNRELASARRLRTSPLFDRHAEAGAIFGSRMGWERPNVFAPGQALDYSWAKPTWLAASAAEQRATREAVAVFDQTSFSKYLLTGPDAVAALQWLCTADIDVPVGRTVYTALLNARGTYESDLTVTRTAEQEYLLVSSAATTVRDQDHLTRHLPSGADLSITDVTDDLGVLGVMGPRSRELLGRLGADVADAEFGESREVEVAGVALRATRITYVGELGWELYVPIDRLLEVEAALLEAGTDLGVRRAGYYAIESLRLEKGYRAFGRELNPDVNPVEAGLLFACKLRTDIDFLGRSALEAARAATPLRRLVSWVCQDPDAMLWGGELLYCDGVYVGQVTSAAWGESVGGCVGLAWSTTTDGDFEVDVAGVRHPATVSLKAPYDPGNHRIRHA